jgi:hypothetical protein
LVVWQVVGFSLPAGCFSEWWALFGNLFLGLPLPLNSLLMILIAVRS